MNERPSPNHDSRNPSVALDYIVLHYTDMMDSADALTRLCNPASKVSAHYLIDENGSIWRMVDETRRAWHAGKSSWRGVHDMNSASIGIELSNPGHSCGYVPFPAAQLAALKDLVKDIAARHRLSLTHAILAHSDIAPARKKDPGELFPWQDFAREGMGLWPTSTPQDLGPATAGEIADMLGAIGYDTTDVPAAIAAFQRRFFPENITGTADPETTAKIRAVRREADA